MVNVVQGPSFLLNLREIVTENTKMVNGQGCYQAEQFNSHNPGSDAFNGLDCLPRLS